MGASPGPDRIEITVELWSTGADDAFERYLDHLLGLLPRHAGRLERRAEEVDAGPSRPDVVLVLSFPDGPSVDGFLRDPMRADHEELASAAVARSLIVDARHRPEPGDVTATVTALHPDDDRTER